MIIENNLKSRIILAKAEYCADAKNISMQLKSGISVLFVIESQNENEKQRILDFITGAVCVLGISIKKVSSDAYLCASPQYMEGYWDTDEKDDFNITQNDSQNYIQKYMQM